jgi:tetratricopeptide (TPR) repeat protein
VLAFTHTLVREVAYERLTRTQRIRRHRAIARWLTDRRDTFADAVDAEAHHLGAALDLARATQAPEEAALAEEAREAFVAAGNRSLQLDLPYAIGLLRDALALTAEDEPSRPDLLVKVTSAGRRAGIVSPGDAAAAYTEAFEAARRRGDRKMAADAMTRAAMDLAFDGATERAKELLDEALSILETLPASIVTVRAYLVRAEDLDFAGRFDEAEPWLDRAAAILEDLPGSGLAPRRPIDEPLDPGAAEMTNILLHLRGDVRCVGGDVAGGIEDIRRTIDLARRIGSAHGELTALSYLAEWVGLSEGPAATLPLQDRALRLSERRGFARSHWWTRAERLWAVADLERWDEVDDQTRAILDAGETVTGAATRSAALWLRLRVLLMSDRLDDAAALVDEALESARLVEQLQLLMPALAHAALVHVARGDEAAALVCVREAIDATAEEGDLHRMLVAADLVRACLRAGDASLAEEVVDDTSSPIPRAEACLASARAAIAEHGGNRAEALSAWRDALAAWEPMGPTFEHRLAREAIARLSAREVTAG